MKKKFTIEVEIDDTYQIAIGRKYYEKPTN